MLCRGYIAKEVGAAHCSQGTTNSAGNMVVARRYVSYQGPQHIEGSAVAKAFLQLHIGCDLVIGHVTGALHHHLHAFVPGALSQLAQVQQLLNLRSIGSISNTAGAQAIAQGNSYIIFGTNIKNFIVVFVQRIFPIIMQHPASNEGTAAANNIHHAAFINQSLEHIAIDATVNGHKIRTICCLLTNYIKDILLRHFDHSPALQNGFYSYLIHGHCTHHHRRRADNSLTRSTDIIAGG